MANDPNNKGFWGRLMPQVKPPPPAEPPSAPVSLPVTATSSEPSVEDEPEVSMGPARVAIPGTVEPPSAPVAARTPTDSPDPVGDGVDPEGPWTPLEPRTWDDLGISLPFAENLILRYLLQIPTDSARGVAHELCIALALVRDVLEQLRAAKLVQHRGAGKMGDFIFELTEAGRARAIESRRVTSYVGPTPVPWHQYLECVQEQSLSRYVPGPEDLEQAFGDLLVSDDVLDRLGPAIASCKALFLFGDPGNGKTSLAERMTRCFGGDVAIPHALFLDGTVIKLYDPSVHVAVDDSAPVRRVDRRWIRIRRPTVIAGGELTLEQLEIQQNGNTLVYEAPLQLKANLGTMVIDDFGRQRVPAHTLLNRWIFPLERRVDYLSLPDGRKLTVPFDAFTVFSTNLEPADLADEAFLRRIPYKIRVEDPTEDEFRAVIEALAPRMRVQLPRGSVNYLIERHYKLPNRPMRFCHPRDLLEQIRHRCAYERRQPVAAPPEWDRAVANYFGAV
jgi:hypothetical protein